MPPQTRSVPAWICRCFARFGGHSSRAFRESRTWRPRCLAPASSSVRRRRGGPAMPRDARGRVDVKHACRAANVVSTRSRLRNVDSTISQFPPITQTYPVMTENARRGGLAYRASHTALHPRASSSRSIPRGPSPRARPRASSPRSILALPPRAPSLVLLPHVPGLARHPHVSSSRFVLALHPSCSFPTRQASRVIPTFRPRAPSLAVPAARFGLRGPALATVGR